MALSVIQEVMDRSYPGPQFSFGTIQVIDAILHLRESRMGRSSLARELGLGDGAVRTMINALKEHNLLEVGKDGCSLTRKGNQICTSLLKRISSPVELGETPFSLGAQTVVILAKGQADKVTSGIQERDEAIKAGGDGATVLLYMKKLFKMPSGPDDCEKEYPDQLWSWLRAIIKPSNGDAIVFGSGPDHLTARRASLAVVRSLLGL